VVTLVESPKLGHKAVHAKLIQLTLAQEQLKERKREERRHYGCLAESLSQVKEIETVHF